MVSDLGLHYLLRPVNPNILRVNVVFVDGAFIGILCDELEYLYRSSIALDKKRAMMNNLFHHIWWFFVAILWY